MIRSLAPTCAAVAWLVLTMTTSAAKPCSGTASVQELCASFLIL